MHSNKNNIIKCEHNEIKMYDILSKNKKIERYYE